MAASIVALGAMLTQAGFGASNTTVVTATVPSATQLDVDGCAPETPQITEFGIVQPGSSSVTTLDCVVSFGSSNDTSMLRAFQRDNTGVSMHTAGNGARDLGFGVNGRRIHNLGGADGLPDWWGGGLWEHGGGDAIRQPDGKILTAGYRGANMVVARFLANGNLDTASFNAPTGYLSIDLGAASSEYGNALALLEDGRIVVAGESNCQFGIALLTTTGTLDTSFNGTGWRRHNLPGGCEGASDVAVQSNGRIVAMGSSTAGSAFAAYLPDGTTDTTFSPPDGISTGDLSANWMRFAIDSSDRILGATGDTCSCDPHIYRFTPDGATDNSFAGDGSRTFPRSRFGGGPGLAWARNVFEDSAGRVVFSAMHDGNGWNSAAVGRLLANGSIDNSFGGDGAVSVNGLGSQTNVVDGIEDSTGNYVIGFNADGLWDGVGWARVGPDGTIDQSVNGTGFTTTPWNDEYATSLLDIGDGGYLMAGTSGVATKDTALWKFAGTPVPDYADDPADVAGNDWGTTAAAFFGACLRGVAAADTNGTTWTPDLVGGADCEDGDLDPWRPIPPTSGSPGAKVAESDGSGQTAATVNLRFGFGAATSQRPGRYVAPITFEVVAPSA